MNLDIGSMVRSGGIATELLGARSTQRTAPKSTFGQKVGANAPSPSPPSAADDARWRAELDRVHSRLRSAMNQRELGVLLDRYAVLVAIRARGMTAAGTLAAPFVPGAAVLSAAVGAVGLYQASGASGAV